MLSALQQLTSVGQRFDRNQVVLEILSQDAALASPVVRRIAGSTDQTITIVGRLPPEQGAGYLVTYQGRSLSLPLLGDYAAGQVVRLGFSADVAAAATPAAAPAMSVAIGADARLIGSVLARGATLAAGAPLPPGLAGGPQASPPAAATLKQALTESGVFYESHLAEWVQGDRTIDQLRHEPQGRLGPADDRAPGPATLAPRPVPDALVAVVKEQLQVIDARQIGWRGEIWPRQTIELTIAEQDAGSGEKENAPAWTTNMKLALPGLGGVEAVLQMQGDALRINLRTSQESAPALKNGSPQLAASLAALGLKLVSMRVEDDEAKTL